MPKIDKVLSLEITPEQFLNNCSMSEIKELDLLLQSPRYQNMIRMAEDLESNEEGELVYGNDPANPIGVRTFKKLPPEKEFQG